MKLETVALLGLGVVAVMVTLSATKATDNAASIASDPSTGYNQGAAAAQGAVDTLSADGATLWSGFKEGFMHPWDTLFGK